MSIYDGLTEPTQENFLYTVKDYDEVTGLTNKVLNYETSGFFGLKNKFMQLIAPINPFHLRQHSHPHGYLIRAIKNGNLTSEFKPYPFKPVLEENMPHHFDPTKEVDYHVPQDLSVTNHTINRFLVFKQEKVPYICEVTKKKFDICKLVNGESKCETEGNNFLEQCPNFALRIYRKNKIFNEKAKIIQRNEYKESMKVASYNKGRSMKDVSKNVNYALGMASNLRPDSMWADDRYINVTQEEINQARAKLIEKNGEFDFKKLKDRHHGNVNDVHYSHSPRMY